MPDFEPDADALCECGDAYDEHEVGGEECTVVGCSCVHFEEADFSG